MKKDRKRPQQPQAQALDARKPSVGNTLGILLPAILLLGIVYLGWGIAAIQMIWERRFLPLFFLSLPVFYCLLLPGSPSNPRFRVPVMPMIVILSSVGLYALAGYLRTRYARSQGKFIRTGETV